MSTVIPAEFQRRSLTAAGHERQRRPHRLLRNGHEVFVREGLWVWRLRIMKVHAIFELDARRIHLLGICLVEHSTQSAEVLL